MPTVTSDMYEIRNLCDALGLLSIKKNLGSVVLQHNDLGSDIQVRINKTLWIAGAEIVANVSCVAGALVVEFKSISVGGISIAGMARGKLQNMIVKMLTGNKHVQASILNGGKLWLVPQQVHIKSVALRSLVDQSFTVSMELIN